LVALIALAGIYTLQRGLRGLTPVPKTYEKMSRYAALSGLARRPSQTPHEYAEMLGHAVPQARDPVGTITEAYTTNVFGRREVAPGDRLNVENAWRRLRNLLLRRSWRGFWQTFNLRNLRQALREWARFVRRA